VIPNQNPNSIHKNVGQSFRDGNTLIQNSKVNTLTRIEKISIVNQNITRFVKLLNQRKKELIEIRVDDFYPFGGIVADP
jgi:hypothetical protein